MRQNRPPVFRGRHFQDELIVLCVCWYLRYSLSYRDLEELMGERDLSVDHSTIARWVLRYAPILSQRMRRYLRYPNRSWRVDETYVRVAGKWTYLYRALDSEGNTIDFLLSPHRDRISAKHFLQLALWRAGHLPRVINVDGHPAYPSVIAELKQTGELSKTCRCRPSLYLNNIIEQDHRFVKKRIVASQWFRSVQGAISTIQGYEAMHMIRKGQIRWLPERRYRWSGSLCEPCLRPSCLISLSHPNSRPLWLICDTTPWSDHRMTRRLSILLHPPCKPLIRTLGMNRHL